MRAWNGRDGRRLLLLLSDYCGEPMSDLTFDDWILALQVDRAIKGKTLLHPKSFVLREAKSLLEWDHLTDHNLILVDLTQSWLLLHVFGFI